MSTGALPVREQSGIIRRMKKKTPHAVAFGRTGYLEPTGEERDDGENPIYRSVQNNGEGHSIKIPVSDEQPRRVQSHRN